MKRFKIAVFIGTVFFILILALALRMRNLAFIPLPGESTDEYGSNAWVGLSLIRLGVPVGKSGLPGYYGNDYRYVNVDHIYSNTARGNPLEINKPWLDHPPLLPLVTGGFAYLSGARVFEDTTAQVIRRPMAIMGVVTVALTGWLAFLLAGPVVSLTTLILIGTSPLMVVSSRIGQSENLLIVFWLLNLIFLSLHLSGANRKWLWLAAIASGLSMLSKVSGIVSVIVGVIILLHQPRKKLAILISEIVLFGLVSLSFFALFFIYGAAIDWNVFKNIWTSNVDRAYDIGFSPIFNLITTTKITISKLLTDGWPLLGWFGLSFFYGQRDEKAKYFVLLPIIIYLVFFLLMGSSSYGWYRTPFMPFLFIAAAWFLSGGAKSVPRMLQAILLLIPLGINAGKIVEILPSISLIPYLRLGLPSLILVFVLFEFLPDTIQTKYQQIAKALYFLLFTIAILTNIILIWVMTPEYWLKIN